MPGPRQLTGNLQLSLAGTALEDVSAYVSSMVLNTTRASITVPAVLSTAQSSTEAGERSQSLTIRFHSGITAAEMWANLYDIIESDQAVADWSATFDPGAVGPDNPRFHGSGATDNGAVLLNLDTGADVGALRQQTVTLPLQGPASKDITP